MIILTFTKEQMSDESQSLATTNKILKKLNKLVSLEIISESLIPVLLEIGILVPTGNEYVCVYIFTYSVDLPASQLR